VSRYLRVVVIVAVVITSMVSMPLRRAHAADTSKAEALVNQAVALRRDGDDRVCQTDCTPAACDPRLIDCGIVDQACDPNGPAADPDCPASTPNCTIYGNICGG
jgi:hypothetical protein